MGIEYIGLRECTIEEIQEIKSVTEAAYKKLLRDFPKDPSFQVHVKKYGSSGARSKYSVHLRLNEPTQKLEATQDDWELARALHRAMDNLNAEVRHWYKHEVTPKKPKGYGQATRPKKTPAH